MKNNILTPKQALNKAYQKLTIHRNEFNLFKENLTKLLQNIDHDESEENVKNHLKDFLNDSFYSGKHLLNTKDKADLVIYLENKQESKSGVLFEVKRPSNKSEMVSKTNLNTKALQELILYYLNERTQDKNDDIKYLVATNIYEWFIFDAVVFENIFYKDKKFVKEYEHWKNDRKVSSNTDHFYNEIAKPQIEKIKGDISFAYFSLKDYKILLDKSDKESEKKLIPLYKILSPIHLLKQPFANDSNSLDKNFYNELLHLIGLEEVKDKNKKIIRRKEKDNRNSGSLIENAIQILTTDNALDKIPDVNKYGTTKDEQYFNVALELTLTWINRILFLKLLESQLYDYNKNASYKFLDSKTIKDYDELYKLFHQVLAVKLKDRTREINKKFNLVPYLNSSLFEITDLENITLKINSLDDSASVDLYTGTVLKEIGGRKKTGKLITLHYLFEFLEAYNFTSEGKEEIEDEKKTLINASVLGLIFEKINGYKDGSFFTPGFITMYMSKESIRRAVIQKFNENYNWECDSFDDLHNHLADKRSAKEVLELNYVINSLKICDPAVGSGHFLVSCLNEIISVKSELGILADENGRVLKGYEAHVANDELIISFNEGEEIFEYYTPLKSNTKSETQLVQETLFREKQTIIENCLFGVDINPNSVSIARLRLWIELLKNAYYTKESEYKELETLPNIDINIKEGNSLVSRFSVVDDYSKLPMVTLQKIRVATVAYKDQVLRYKTTNDRETRIQVQKRIKSLKEEFIHIANPNEKTHKRIRELENKLIEEVLHFNIKEKEQWEENRKKIQKEYDELVIDYNTKQRTLYSNAFEWRFEFPEVLDNDGNYIGFDVVIGNPPYQQLQKDKGKIGNALKNLGYQTFEGTGDIYVLFYELAFKLLKTDGYLTFITSSQWIKAGYGKSLRQFLLSKNPLILIMLGPGIFESATVDTNILTIQNCSNKKTLLGQTLQNTTQIELIDFIAMPYITNSDWSIQDNVKHAIAKKIKAKGKALRNWKLYIYFGIKTGYNEAYVIDEETQKNISLIDDTSNEIIRPVIRGREINKYYTPWDGSYLIATLPALDIDIEKYPAVKKYLEQFIPKINQTGEVFVNKNGIKEKTRKKTNNKWFETQDQIAFYEEFAKEKIIWKRIGSSIRFSYSEDEIYCLDSTCIATGEKVKYLTALLNSKLCNYQLIQNAPRTGMGDLILSVQAIEPLLVYYPNKIEQKNIEIIFDQILVQKKQNPDADTSTLEAKIDEMVYKLYGLTEEEIKIVEESL